MSQPVQVLSLQAYYGGSHAQFHDGWTANSSLNWTTLTLPSRHWKWRMRHASIYFSEKIQELAAQGQTWKMIVCTDMLNVAEFKGLLPRELASIPILVYFHENQFEYPNRAGFKRDQHFPFTNFTTALAADHTWYNSRFNFDSMLDGLNRQSKRWPDFVPAAAIGSLESKLEIQPPGIDLPPVDVNEYLIVRKQRAVDLQPMHIVWAARWEHDKNAEDLLAALKILTENDLPFRLSVLGQSFRYLPPVFDEIKSTFPDQISRWGFQESRKQYWEALAEADIFVSTANHEFFGLSAAEAIAVGLHPVFPNRLAYPELLGHAYTESEIESCLYDGTAGGLAQTLTKIHQQRSDGNWDSNLEASTRLIDQIGWDSRAKQLDDSLNGLLSPPSKT